MLVRACTPNVSQQWCCCSRALHACSGAQPPRFEFYDPQTPIYTSPRFLPPAKIVKSKIHDAIISHGSYLEECTITNAIVGLRSRIDKGAVIQVSGPL
jgi:ADP-glucose pyrophosphorylase